MAANLKLAAEFLFAGSGSRVIYVQTGGFDDHANEKEAHSRVLQTVDEAVGAFYKELEAQGIAERTAVLMFSEFVRRVVGNGSGGTDQQPRPYSSSADE